MSKGNNKTVRQTSDEHKFQWDPSLGHPHWAGPMTPYNQKLPQFVDPDQFSKELMNFITQQTEADISPFYAHLLSGQLSKKGAQEWIKQLYFDARFFPILIAQIVANSYFEYDVRQCYGVNLAEELGEFNPVKEHPILLRKVGRALGLTDQDMEFVKPLPEVLVYTEYRQSLVKHGSVVEGVAAGSLSNEATIVARYRKIIKVLKSVYNLKDEDLEYFYVHSGGQSEIDYGGDWAHANEALETIKRYATTPELQEKVRVALWKSIEARKVYQWGLFRGIVLANDESYRKILERYTAPYENQLKLKRSA